MNTERTSSSASRSSVLSSSGLQFSGLVSLALTLRRFRVFFAWMAAALALVGLGATASLAGLKSATPGGTGAVLALAAQLRTARLRAAAASHHAPSGRALQPRRMMHAGAIVSRAASAPAVVPISGGVQTYDVNNPPPAFRPLVGYGSLTALNNSSTNPPVYISSLTPTNLTPVWSADETFLIFSSNRTQTGGVNADATDGSGGSRFHLWAISVNGGEAFQITTSTGPTGGGEFFPALSQNNLAIAFTSDAQSPGTQNLFAFGFSYSALTAGASAVNLTPSAANTNPPASLTLRASTEAASAALTGFGAVLRPTFSPNDSQLLVFSAVATSAADPNGGAGHAHLYFLYTSSGGFSNDNNVSFPGKLTDGPSDDTDPTFAPDGSYIAFASTANSNGFTRNPNNAFGPTNPSSVQNPSDSQSLSTGAAATRSVFLISGGLSSTGVPFGTVPTTANSNLSGTGGRISLGSTAGFDDYGPAWSNFANENQYTNPTGDSAYLAFSRSTASMTAPHDIYFFLAATGVSDPTTEFLTPETATGSSNASIKLNTDDNANETSASGDVYEDAYPTWSPFLSIFSIAYSSDRTVTYNNPTGGAPVEVAASVPEGGSVTNSQDSTQNYSVGASYAGLLVSQVLNLDPPTLLRFSNNEVVHVQAGTTANPVTGVPNKLAASGGQAVTLTVRLSDRESGIDNTGGPNGGPRVYVQIKDPDSKYQDSQGLEHKVFMKDLRYDAPTQTNHATYDTSSGTANALLDVYNFTLPTSDLYSSLYNLNGIQLPSYQRFIYPSYGNAGDYLPIQGTDSVNFVNPRGTHGGQWQADAANNPNNTHLFVGKGAIGTTNPNGMFSFPVTGGRESVPYPGTDPNQFIPHGPEYECQVVNPTFEAAGTGDTTTTDYATPYYLAGVDDQNAFSGGTFGQGGTDRPTADYSLTANGTTATHPAEWLQLTRVPAVQQDNLGGVLYTVTWTTPLSDSDFYVDVIAYDKATFPNIPGASNTGGRANWRIYDNVGGFSTNQSVGSNDILVVSDYTLGQKFAGTTFSGQNTNQNLVPKLFGTESYLTDVDINILPDSVYAGIPSAEADAMGSAGPPATAARVAYQFAPVVQPFDDQTVYSLFTSTGAFPDNNQALVATQNGLGAQSYLDGVINDNTINTDGSSNVASQRYSIWRILSRGPVPQSVLNSYLPTPTPPQPAIFDAADPTFKNVPAAVILSAPRCVIWMSPYTGDVLADPGTIDDPGNVGTAGVTNPRPSTTSILTAFVQAGGRLCITGQDVGSTLTQNGTVANSPSTTAGSPNFLPDVLNATLVSGNSGSNVLAGTDNRITGNPFYDHSTNADQSFVTLVGPIQGDNPLQYPNYPYQDNLVIGDADYGDGALSQIPSRRITFPPFGGGTGSSVQGEPDVINALNGAQVAMTYAGGGTAMVFHDDPYSASGTHSLPNGGTGSRVVYAGFGLEGLSQDYYSSASPNPSGSAINPPNPLPLNEIIPAVIPRNPRSGVLHNIVNFLRTGFVSGKITQTAGTGQGGGLGISGVTVYLHPTVNPATGVQAVPPSRAAFSAMTDSNGIFQIAGVEPGTYTLVALKPGFQRAVSNNGVSYTVEGDTTAKNATLTMTPQQPGSIAGAVHDTSGNLINGSVVTFTSQDNSVTVAATTANGSVTGSTTENYFIQDVPVTNYTATASSPLNPQGQPEYTAATAPDAPTTASPPTPPNTDYSQGVIVQPTTTDQNVNFTLTPILGTISGTVTNAVTGAGIGGATVAISSSAGQSYGSLTTALDGTYTLPNIPASQTGTSYVVTVTAPGFAPSLPQTFTVYLGSVITGANFTLTPIAPGSITGTVTYSTGGPVSGAIVTFQAPGGTAQTTTTAADGTYTIPNVPPAVYTVTAVGPNNTNGKPTTTAAPAQSVTVTSGAQSTASFVVTPIEPTFIGTVFSSASGNPTLANATVTVNGTPTGSTTAITPVVVTTNSSGIFTTASGALAPGTYTLTATLAGYAASTDGPVTVQLGDSNTGENFVLAAVPPGSITGTVLDNHGNPVNKATVQFKSVDGTVPALTATTNSSGAYVIPPSGTAGIPASTYNGTATGTNSTVTGAAQYGAAPTQTVTVSSSTTTTANFVLPVILASVTGTVTDAQTSAVVAGATVTLTDASGNAVGGPVTTGSNGTYSFTNILAGQMAASYTVSAAAPNYSSGSVPVTLSLGDELTGITVPLNEQVTLYGLVTDGSPDVAGQPPLAGVTITVTNSSGSVVATTPATVTTTSSTSTGPDGQQENYSATLLPGTYTITATKGGYTSQTTAAVTLTNQVPVRQNFALVSGIGTLGGLVTNQNGTGLVSGATVTAIPTGSSTGLTFTTAASSTPGPDGSPLNYSGQLAQGTYTVTVTLGSRTSAAQTVTVAGGTFTRLDFTTANGLPALHTFPAGIQFVSTPYDYSALGFSGLFGTLNTAPAGTTPNGNRSNVAVWNPAAGAYALDPNAPADALRLGVGYWVYLKNATPVTQQGATPASSTGFIPVSLGQGWNQIGVPNPSASGIPVASLMFDNGTGGMITFAQASSSQYNLVTRPLYGYAGGGYDALTSTGVLTPWSGYWIYVNSSATLEIPVATSAATTTTTTTTAPPPP